MALAVGLMGATKPRYGAFQVTGVGQYGPQSGFPGDTLTWLFCIDDSGSVHTEWPADPDSILEDQAGEIFKFDNVSKGLPDSAAIVGATTNTAYSTEATIPNASAVMSMMWWDLSMLPRNITILDAKLCALAANAIDASDVYGRYAVLDTTKRDERWLSPTSMVLSTGQVRMTRACWATATRKTGGEWVPLLDNRHDLADFGILSTRNGAAQTVGGEATFDVKDAVQQYANYRHANAGFWLTGTINSFGASYYRCFTTTPLGRMPFLRVTFIRKPHRFQWGGYPVAFAFTTDDQVNDNMGWKAICDSFGYKFTLYCRGDVMPFTQIAETNRLSIAQLQEFYADGYEIGHHSTTHSSPNAGVWGLGDISDADSMNAQLVRPWLATALGIPTSSITTFAYPSGGFNLLAIERIKAHGFLLARGAGDTTYFPTWTDAERQTYLRSDRPRNLFQVANLVNIQDLVGYAAADTVGYAGMVERFNDAVAKSARNGYAPIIIVTHDTKARTTYPDGIDFDDLSILCRLIQQNGHVGVFTMGRIAEMHRGRHHPVDPPDWATKAIADGQVAADSIWWGN
ncbi:MAG: hypothetical protein WC120_05420 [Parcubacteria group bacterium]